MAYGYILLEKAQLEYEDSFLWYAARSTAAVELFIDAVEYALELICSNPYMWRNEYKDFHELCLKKYPFSIIFTIDTKHELVVITSIYHHSRNNKKKYRK